MISKERGTFQRVHSGGYYLEYKYRLRWTVNCNNVHQINHKSTLKAKSIMVAVFHASIKKNYLNTDSSEPL